MSKSVTSDQQAPALSAAMSVYNGERFLAEAIDSILAQSFPDLEFLILDDGSRDATPAMLRDYAEKDSRIRPIIRENRGLVASLNQLLDNAASVLLLAIGAWISLEMAAASRVAYGAVWLCIDVPFLQRMGGLFHSSAGGQLAAIGAGIGRGGSAHRAILHFLGTAG